MNWVPEHRTLIVAYGTASTPLLLEELDRRAAERPTAFALLIPNVASKDAADWTLKDAVPALRRAARGPTGHREAHVEGVSGEADAFESVKQALADGHFDDVLISTLPKRTSEWLKRDLPRRVEGLGVPVSVITQPTKKRPSLNDIPTSLGKPQS